MKLQKKWMALGVGIIFFFVLRVSAVPVWWSQRNVIVTNTVAKDYAAVNAGQVYNIAKQAYLEMEDKWASVGGAGTILRAWVTNDLPGYTNFNQTVNIGQLKNLAKPFYDRLVARGLIDDYPWNKSNQAANDFALVNVGQVKQLFSFEIPALGNAELQVFISADKTTANVEETITFTITVTNNSFERAHQVIISNEFSKNFTFAFDLPDGWLLEDNTLFGSEIMLEAYQSTNYSFSISLDETSLATNFSIRTMVSHAGLDEKVDNTINERNITISWIPPFECDGKYIYFELTPADLKTTTTRLNTGYRSNIMDINNSGRIVFLLVESISENNIYVWEKGELFAREEKNNDYFFCGINDLNHFVTGGNVFWWSEDLQIYRQEELLLKRSLHDIINEGVMIGEDNPYSFNQIYLTPEGDMYPVPKNYWPPYRACNLRAINEDGYAVGFLTSSSAGTKDTPIYHRGKNTYKLGSHPNSQPLGVNNNDMVVGKGTEDDTYWWPSIWSSLSEDSEFSYLKGRTGVKEKGYASDINDKGQIIGNISNVGGVIWKSSNHTPESLSNKIGFVMDAELAVPSIDYVWRINENGQIIGASSTQQRNHGEHSDFPFLLTPYCLDSDGDGITDGWEVENGFDIYDPDDTTNDDDLDGIPNVREAVWATDRFLSDTDGDYLDDYEEIMIFNTDPLNPDTDGDGVFDYDELFWYNTDPFDPDADKDGDGLLDWEEVLRGNFELVDTQVTWKVAQAQALDEDGYLATITSTNEWNLFQEIMENEISGKILHLGGIDFHGNNDWLWIDGDPWKYTLWASNEPSFANTVVALQINENGQWISAPLTSNASFIVEFDAPSSPNDFDTDDDGLVDGPDGAVDIAFYPEGYDLNNNGYVDGELTYGTDPLSNDTDNDYLPDVWEIYWGLDPLDGTELHGWEGDYDQDGLNNYEEYYWDTNPTAKDSDGDGFDDAWEIANIMDPNAGTTNNLILWYKFDETTGNTIYDSTTNHFDAGINTVANTWPWGISLGAQEFDGVDDQAWGKQYFPVERLRNGFSYSVWVYPDFEDESKRQTLFYLPSAFDVSLVGRNVEIFTYPDKHIFTNTKLIHQEWSNLTITWDGSLLNYYFNGELALSTNVELKLNLPSADLRISSAVDKDFFKGSLDDLRIYSIPLDEFDVWGNYEAGMDFDADGYANASEYLKQTDPFNKESFPIKRGDLNADGVVDNEDLTLLKNNLKDYQEEITRYFYDENSNLTNQINALGHSSKIQYNKNDKPIVNINPLNHATRTEYDTRNRVIRIIDPKGSVESVSYNAFDNPTQKVDRAGYITRFAYNNIGQLIESTDPRGSTSKMEYDDLHRQTRITQAYGGEQPIQTRFEYDLADNVTAKINALDVRIEFIYDAMNRKIREIHAAGIADAISLAYEYDDRGQLIRQIDARGNVINMEYDANGHLIATTDPLGNIHQNKYDSLGNVIEVVKPDGRVIRTEYDQLNRPVKNIEGDAVATVEYDAAGRVIESVNFRGIRSKQIYDAVGNIIQHIEAVGTSEESVTTLKYDKLNNITQRINAESHKIHHEYDPLGRLIKSIDEIGKITRFEYEDGINLTKLVKPDGTIVQHFFDELNRKTHTKVNGIIQQEFAYDVLSRMTQAWDYNQPGTNTDDKLVEFTYNALDRETSQIQNGKIIQNQFDKNGNLVDITYPSGLKVTRTYNRNNQPVNVSAPLVCSASYEYDANSKLTQLTYGNGTTQKRTFDARERLATLEQIGGNLNNTWELQHDKNGNVTYASLVNQHAETFNYDALDRVKDRRANISQILELWEYDKMGNWLNHQTNNTTQPRTVNQANQYTTVNGQALNYDLNGNITTLPVNTVLYSSSLNMSYDWLNRLTEAKDTLGNIIATYAYDALNRRVSKHTAETGQLTTYIYSGAEVIAEYEQNSLVRQYITGNSIDRPVAMIHNTASYYYHYDWRANVHSLSDTSGLTVEKYTYSTFGVTTIEDPTGNIISKSAIGNPYAYAGRRFDPETRLYHYRNRMYSPELGRFLQKDPAGFVDGMNIYAYVRNNPLRYFDPYGLLSWSTITKPVKWVADQVENGGEIIVESGEKIINGTGKLIDEIKDLPEDILDTVDKISDAVLPDAVSDLVKDFTKLYYKWHLEPLVNFSTGEFGKTINNLSSLSGDVVKFTFNAGLDTFSVIPGNINGELKKILTPYYGTITAAALTIATGGATASLSGAIAGMVQAGVYNLEYDITGDIINLGVSAITSYMGPGIAQAALSGSISTGISTAINGGDFGDVFENGLKAGVMAGASAYINGKLGPGKLDSYTGSAERYFGHTVFAGAIGGVANGSLQTVIYGGDLEDNIRSSAIKGTINSTATGVVGYQKIRKKGGPAGGIGDTDSTDSNGNHKPQIDTPGTFEYEVSRNYSDEQGRLWNDLSKHEQGFNLSDYMNKNAPRTADKFFEKMGPDAKNWKYRAGLGTHNIDDSGNIDFRYAGENPAYQGYQLIYDSEGGIVLENKNWGTYDTSTPVDFGSTVRHFINDVVPWFRRGNGGTDDSTLWQRLKAIRQTGTPMTLQEIKNHYGVDHDTDNYSP